MNRFSRYVLFFLAASIFGSCVAKDQGSTRRSFPDLRFDVLTIDRNVRGPAFLEVGYVNEDAHLDIVLSSFGEIQGTVINPGHVDAYLGTESIDTFRKTTIVNSDDEIYFPNDIVIRDIDDDGDMDVALGYGFLPCMFLERYDRNGQLMPPRPCGGLSWFEQDSSAWNRHDLVTPNSEYFFHRALFSDFDDDGIEDIIAVGEIRPPEGKSGDEAKMFFFQGQLPLGEFGEATQIGDGLGSLPELHDMDDDGDFDLVGAEYFANKGASFVWYERKGVDPSVPTSWVRHVMSNTLGPSIQLSGIKNLFGDGKTIFVGSNHSNTTLVDADEWESGIYVLRDHDGEDSLWHQDLVSNHIVSRPIPNQAAPGIFSWGDVDGDGDIDLLVSGDGDSRIFVIEQGPSQTFTTWTLATNLPQTGGLRLVDLDSDGQMEILLACFEANAFQIFKPNPQGEVQVEKVASPEWSDGVTQTSVEVVFDETLNGPLILAVFESYPPTTAPLSFKLVAEPENGAIYKIDFAQAGQFKVFALIDVDGSGPMGLTEGDAYAVFDATLPTDDTLRLELRIDEGTNNPQPSMPDEN